MDTSLILCAVDFSPGSRVALEAAGELARAGQRRLLLLHVFHPPLLSFGVTLPTVDNVLTSFTDVPTKHLEALQGQLADRGIDAEMALVEGAPWKQIVQVAAERSAGLIVLGAHGQTSLGDALLGSVAERVVRHAPCSVLVVRTHATTLPL